MQLVLAHVHFADLLSSHPLGQSLDSPSNKGTTLFKVAVILGMEDLEFPILLDKRVDEGSIVVERGIEDGIEHDCALRCGYALWSKMIRRFCIEGQTLRSTLPGVSIAS